MDGNDVLFGAGSNDVLYGDGGNDVLFGGEGPDTLSGGYGIDTLYGGAGYDIYVWNAEDTFREDDNDSFEIDIIQTYVTVDLATATNVIGRIEGLQLVPGTLGGDLYGNHLDNLLIGNISNNILDGRAGADEMRGGGSNDTYYIDDVNDRAIEYDEYNGADADGNDTIRVAFSYVLESLATQSPLFSKNYGVENIGLQGTGNIDATGNEDNNWLGGTEGNNTLTGNQGDDTLLGEGGNDTLLGGAGHDNLFGGYGDDFLNSGGGGGGLSGNQGNDVYHANSDDTITENNAAGSGYDTVNYYGGSEFDLGLNTAVEMMRINDPNTTHFVRMTGSDYAQTIYSNSGDNEVFGLGGNDSIYTGAGNDLLVGGAGKDLLDAGDGNDTLNSEGGGDTMIGGAGNDTYHANSDDIIIESNAANGGTDTVYFYNGTVFEISSYDRIEVMRMYNASATSNIEMHGNLGSQTISGNAGNNLIAGNGGLDFLYGNAGSDTLLGGLYSDVLDGGAGTDFMQGRKGDDTYIVDNAADVVDEGLANSDGTDLVRSAITFSLNDTAHAKGLVENLTLLGSANINATGNALANVLSGNVGANTLVGLGGNDVMRGMGGNDLYGVADAGDIVDESAVAGPGGIDTVNGSISIDLSDAVHFKGALENAAVLGSANLNATGNALNNVLTGNTGANKLVGLGGNDTMRGGAGNDTYGVAETGDIVDEGVAGSAGIDTVVGSISVDLSNFVQFKGNLEHATVIGTANLNVTGNALNNILIGNAGGNTLIGYAGTDIMRGMAGNDVYGVTDTADVVDESASGSGGIDRVNASISININDAARFKGSIENASLIGSANLSLTGNMLGNVLTGNGGANVITGWNGNDTMTGGAGNDIFQFNSALNAATNVDTITDMNQNGNDTIRLENAIFTTLAAGALAASAFHVGAAAADANDRIVYNSANGQLSYDVNGSASGGATFFAVLDTGLALMAADFFVV